MLLTLSLHQPASHCAGGIAAAAVAAVDTRAFGVFPLLAYVPLQLGLFEVCSASTVTVTTDSAVGTAS